MSVMEEYALQEFVFQACWPLDFVGYRHTLVSAHPRLVLVEIVINAELQTRVYDDNLFKHTQS